MLKARDEARKGIENDLLSDPIQRPFHREYDRDAAADYRLAYGSKIDGCCVHWKDGQLPEREYVKLTRPGVPRGDGPDEPPQFEWTAE